MTTNAGLASSEGWKEWPARRSQRLAPLISGPDTSTATISPSMASSSAKAKRRAWRGEHSETANISTRPTTVTSRCRST